jgi:hypothetical protein
LPQGNQKRQGEQGSSSSEGECGRFQGGLWVGLLDDIKRRTMVANQIAQSWGAKSEDNEREILPILVNGKI